MLLRLRVSHWDRWNQSWGVGEGGEEIKEKTVTVFTSLSPVTCAMFSFYRSWQPGGFLSSSKCVFIPWIMSFTFRVNPLPYRPNACVRWAKHCTQGCVQFSQLQQFTLGFKHSLIDIGPKVRSLSVLMLPPWRASCACAVSDFGYLLMTEEANRSIASQRSRVENTAWVPLCVDAEVWTTFTSHRRDNVSVFSLHSNFCHSIYIKLTHWIYYIKPFQPRCQSACVFSGRWAVSVVTCNKLYHPD